MPFSPSFLPVSLLAPLLMAPLTSLANQSYEAANAPPQTWLPPAVSMEQWDWIQLASGEWIKGHLKVLHEESVEFDSDHFDLIDVDWGDVVFIQTSRVMKVLLEGGEVVLGRLETHQGRLSISGYPVAFAQVVGVASASQREQDLWSVNVALGMNFRSGNVDQKDLNAKAVLKRRTVANSTRISYTGNYSESESDQLANNHSAELLHDYRISNKWFFRPIQAQFYRDPFQNRDQEWTLGMGAGYRIFDTAKLDWSVAAGPGYQYTEYVDVAPGEERVVKTPAFLLSSYYDQEVTGNIDLLMNYQITVTEPKAGRSKHDFYTALDVDLTRRLDLRLAGSWKRIENPQPDSSGVTPEKDDFMVTLGLSLEI